MKDMTRDCYETTMSACCEHQVIVTSHDFSFQEQEPQDGGWRPAEDSSLHLPPAGLLRTTPRPPSSDGPTGSVGRALPTG